MFWAVSHITDGECKVHVSGEDSGRSTYPLSESYRRIQISSFNWYPPRIHYISTDHTFAFVLYYFVQNIMGSIDTSLVDMYTISNGLYNSKLSVYMARLNSIFPIDMVSSHSAHFVDMIQ